MANEKNEKRGCVMVLDPKTSVDADGHILVNGEVRAIGTAELIKDNPVPVDLIFVLDDVRLDWICERLAAKLIIETRSAVKSGKIKASDVVKPGFRIPVSLFANKEGNRKSVNQTLAEGIINTLKNLPKDLWLTVFKASVTGKNQEAIVGFMTELDPEMSREIMSQLN